MADQAKKGPAEEAPANGNRKDAGPLPSVLLPRQWPEEEAFFASLRRLWPPEMKAPTS